MSCPCKGCEDRTLTCHSVCRKYEDWKIEQAAIKDYLREATMLEISDNVLRKSWRNKRYSRRKYVTNK